MDGTTDTSGPGTGLRPQLSLLDAALYTIVMNIGLRWLPVAAAVGPAALPLWVLALVTFFVPLAAATGALTARFKGEGGIYLWTRDSFGPLAGFLCGWFYWFALMPYFAGIVYFLAQILMSGLGLDTKNTTLYLGFTVALSVLVTAVQFAGLRIAKWLPNSGTIASWLIFMAIAGIALLLVFHGASATDFSKSSYLPPINFDTAILWGTIVFAYSGVEAVGFMRNEFSDGLKTALRVLGTVGPALAVVYIAGTAAMLVILPASDMTRLGGFADTLHAVFDRAHLGTWAPIALILFALSQTGGLTAWFAAGARLPLAAGIDNFLPAMFARRNPSTGAPVAAIYLQGALMIVFVILGQAGASAATAYDFLVNMSVLTNTICYAFLFAAYYKLARSANSAGEWRAPGGKGVNLTLAIVGQVATWTAIVCTLVPSGSDPHPLVTFLKISGSAGFMVAIGVLLYWSGNRRRLAALSV
ncbi:MAG: APC family permease [Rhizomicrobium sp.]|jgi:amino acid transporter